MTVKETFKKTPHAIHGLIVLIITGAILMYLYSDLENTVAIKEAEEKRLKEDYWLTVNMIIEEERRRASQMSQSIANNIREDLLVEYKSDMNTLKFDIKNPSENSRLSKIVRENVDGNYLNIDNDNNDPFVTFVHEIYYDGSLNCSAFGRSRSWNEEVTMHSNKKLAKTALEALEYQSTEDIYWEFIKSKNKNHKLINEMTNGNLKAVFMKEGLKGLSTYEFLEASYIDGNKDIFGKYAVSNLGKKQENDMMIIVQGFNIVDAINTNHSDLSKHFVSRLEILEVNYNWLILHKTLSTLFITVMLLVVFIIFINLHNKSVRK